MAKSEKNLNAVFTDTANAIRAKGVTGTMTPRDFADKIGTIPTGVTPTGTKDITANGTYDVTNFANAKVTVPQPSGTYNVTANGSYDVTWYDVVDVNVPSLIDLENENSSLSMDLETRCSHMSLYGGWDLDYSDPRYDLMTNNKGYQAVVACSYDESAEEGHRCTFELMSGYELVPGEEYGLSYGSCILIAPVICGQDLNLSGYDINGYFMMCYEFSSEQIAEVLEEYPYNECYIYSMDGFCVGSFSVSEKIRTNS